MSKSGPKSAEDMKSTKTISVSEFNFNDFDIDGFLHKRDFNISKSQRAGIHLKHMVSEILLLIACNKNSPNQ